MLINCVDNVGHFMLLQNLFGNKNIFEHFFLQWIEFLTEYFDKVVFCFFPGKI